MTFDQMSGAPRRIAVIGGGISGMGAANLLADTNQVTLFEAAPRLGGHARTKVAGKRGDQPVDTGFIVFNKATYPNLVRLFDRLEVPIVESNMSFGVSARGGAVEYSLSSANALFAQRRNLVQPRFLRMLRDLFLFNSRAVDFIDDRSITVRELLEHLGTGEWFRSYYLEPFSGAIWSTPKEKILDFPAHAMIRFFDNHLLLDARQDHQWYTVQGGSIEYVRRMETVLREKQVDLRLGAKIDGVRRMADGPQVKAQGGEWERFDLIVLATHSDDTLSLLSDPTPQESAALGAIRYQPNDVVLHADPSVMPRRRRCWASWVHTEDAHPDSTRVDITYWMNSLQPIPDDDPMFVTLNSRRRIREDLIYDEAVFRHPVFDLAALNAQEEIRQFNGANSTWFCGAWMRHGFHEDGLASAVDVAEGINRSDAARMAAE